MKDKKQANVLDGVPPVIHKWHPSFWVNLDLKHQTQTERENQGLLKSSEALGPEALGEGPRHAAAGHTGESTPPVTG